jgi:hypothetical protein
MNEFLQVIGSIASIGGIPLAIYLYLRSREAKFIKLRSDIVKILSYQIGEGRSLSVFEIKAVIDSKVREANGKPGIIEADEIIEDLVSETISSPLLNSDRKNEILKNLRENHRNSTLFAFIDDKNVQWQKIIQYVSEHDIEHEDASKIVEVCVEKANLDTSREKPKYAEKTSEIFGLVAVITTAVAASISIVGGEGFFKYFSSFIKENQSLLNILAGILASVIAILITIVFEIINRNRKQKNSAKKNFFNKNI